MKRRRSHRRSKTRRKLNHQRKEGGRGRRLLRFRRRDGEGDILIEVIALDETPDSSKKAA